MESSGTYQRSTLPCILENLRCAACHKGGSNIVQPAATLLRGNHPALHPDRRFLKRLCRAACHKGGGNIVQPGATLLRADLERNGVLDVDALYAIIYSGKGKMYGFGQECAPKGRCTFGTKLADADVRALAELVLRNADGGW